MHKYFRILCTFYKLILYVMNWCSLSMVISFVLKTILSDINIITKVFFLLVLAWCMFSFFYFKTVCVFIFKVLSCRQHIIESFIKSDICLLIGILRPFTRSMIIDTVRFKFVFLLFAFCLFHLLCILFFLFLPSCDLINFFMIPLFSWVGLTLVLLF